jgi:hypothetical protein
MIDWWKISAKSFSPVFVLHIANLCRALFERKTSATAHNLLPRMFYAQCKVHVDAVYIRGEMLFAFCPPEGIGKTYQRVFSALRVPECFSSSQLRRETKDGRIKDEKVCRRGEGKKRRFSWRENSIKTASSSF